MTRDEAYKLAKAVTESTIPYANGINVRIYPDMTEAEIANEFPQYTGAMRTMLHMLEGEDYAIIEYRNGYKRFLNITGNSDWCTITEIAKKIMRHM